MNMVKDGSLVEQVVKPVRGRVMRKDICDDKVRLFVLDDEDQHEYVLDMAEVKVLQEPSNDEPVAEAAPTGDQPAA